MRGMFIEFYLDCKTVFSYAVYDTDKEAFRKIWNAAYLKVANEIVKAVAEGRQCGHGEFRLRPLYD